MDSHQRTLLMAAGAGALVAWGLSGRSGYQFRNKVALVTGGSRGLGLALCHELKHQGATVITCGRDAQTLERAVRQLGGGVTAIPCDVTNRDHVYALIREVLTRFGRIDVLINNAGTIGVGAQENQSIADFEKTMAINFWGPLYTMLAAAPSMKERGEGRIVNIASIGGKIAVPHLAPYSASKFALVGVSKALRAEWARQGIVVTTICPGLMRTGSPRNAEFKGQNKAEYAWFSISDSQPLTAMGTTRAARQILDACRQGRAEVVLTTQAKMAAKFDSLFPEWSADAMDLMNRMLPDPVPGDVSTYKGYESQSTVSPSWVTKPGDEAARKWNQMQAR
jgi:NAD(P)-dependent dehydrogenase (short-subunit alcohol dehydrogenase family)